ncbi:unnamed protein product [Arctia plantaginis]|uniref:Uncharacterized protein n=1 Tax=Arctia plantaginis TaxID=874455 RepID=A0A8S0YQA7_ARCPL|nr:unnamed protein product [Arctia plantaginis]
MTLYKLLVVILATCASSSAAPTKPLPYAESFEEVKLTEKILTDMVLSMAGENPHLNDYRRHYSEIAHTVYHIAYFTVMAQRCNKSVTDDLYEKLLEESVTEVISNTTYVVEITQQFLDDLNAKTQAIQKLVNISCANDINKRDCNAVIQNFILNDPEKYEKEASALLVAGESAKVFNINSDKFDYISKELEAHKYVIRNPVEFKNIIDALIKLVLVLYPTETFC